MFCCSWFTFTFLKCILSITLCMLGTTKTIHLFLWEETGHFCVLLRTKISLPTAAYTCIPAQQKTSKRRKVCVPFISLKIEDTLWLFFSHGFTALRKQEGLQFTLWNVLFYPPDLFNDSKLVANHWSICLRLRMELRLQHTRRHCSAGLGLNGLRCTVIFYTQTYATNPGLMATLWQPVTFHFPKLENLQTNASTSTTYNLMCKIGQKCATYFTQRIFSFCLCLFMCKYTNALK